MKTRGTVKEVKSDHVVIECERRSACVSCEFAASCAEKCEKTLTRATDKLGAKVGDEVEIERDTSSFLFNAFLFFIAPLIVIAVVYLLLSLFLSEVTSAILSVGAALIYTVVSGLLLNKKAGGKYPGRVVRIITLKNESEIDSGK